ncbi:MAG: serine--tRNA ligase [Candidatus Heimdallarchaeota archaeon]
MLDIKIIRETPELVKQTLKARGYENQVNWVDDVLEYDTYWRKYRHEENLLREKRNKISKKLPSLSTEEKAKKIAEMKEIGPKLERAQKKRREFQEKRQYILDRIPNLIHESVPRGLDESDNVEIRRWGEIPFFSFKPKDHVELMTQLDLLEIERASKVSGSRFYYLKNKAMILDLALIRFALDHLIKKGFIPFLTPVLVRKRALYGTGFLPLGADGVYFIEGEDLGLIGTSEIALGALYMDEILEEKDLPKWYSGFSPCFRTEAGTTADTKGIFRVHKFHKVEMYKFCKPECSWEEFNHLIETAEEIFKQLELPYRIMNLCSGDLGIAAAKTYDLEVWIPSQSKYREAVSCSNTTDFQARRLNIRFRRKEPGTPVDYLHTLNSTALATNRAIIAIIEVNQKEDGSVQIPKALWDYTGFKEIALTDKT